MMSVGTPGFMDMEDEKLFISQRKHDDFSLERLAELLNKIQKIFVDDVPAIPIGTHPQLGEYNTRKYTGWPSEKDPYATADPTQPWAVQVLMNLKPAKN